MLKKGMLAAALVLLFAGALAQKRQVMLDKVVAVVGDGALTGGMCYEALNDAGSRKTPLILVLNDNGMSISRNVVDYVVTEYGIAHLRGKTVRQRRDALISIAHPDFRDELTFEAKKNGLIY